METTNLMYFLQMKLLYTHKSYIQIESDKSQQSKILIF
jgi:hypothetical protein